MWAFSSEAQPNRPEVSQRQYTGPSHRGYGDQALTPLTPPVGQYPGSNPRYPHTSACLPFSTDRAMKILRNFLFASTFFSRSSAQLPLSPPNYRPHDRRSSPCNTLTLICALILASLRFSILTLKTSLSLRSLLFFFLLSRPSVLLSRPLLSAFSSLSSLSSLSPPPSHSLGTRQSGGALSPARGLSVARECPFSEVTGLRIGASLASFPEAVASGATGGQPVPALMLTEWCTDGRHGQPRSNTPCRAGCFFSEPASFKS